MRPLDFHGDKKILSKKTNSQPLQAEKLKTKKIKMKNKNFKYVVYLYGYYTHMYCITLIMCTSTINNRLKFVDFYVYYCQLDIIL
jgi:hypothetical protein